MTEIEDAGDLLHHAHLIVTGERNETHGAKERTFEKIAVLWNATLLVSDNMPPRPLTGHDVAMLMADLKKARIYSGRFNEDDYLDGCGYLACAFELRKGISNGHG